MGKILQPFWRMTRGLTLGVQGMIIDENDQILLVRHGYRPGWHLPGGGVERGETIIQALGRELHEEVGVELAQAPKLHGIFANFTHFPGDHIAVYIVRHWHQINIPQPSVEILEQKFVSLDKLPEELAAGAGNRIREHFEDVAITAGWIEGEI
ncbi:MAG: NUDIX domain-containing protein [bacterium]|nr:NUDIX domain-containing protein [bacterium]